MPGRAPAVPECRYQYTVTSGTPMHSSKLKYWVWLQALYFVITSSKGISSVVLARNLGVTQSTAWRLGHSIREMMHDRDGKGPLLKGDVEIDLKYLGGRRSTARMARSIAAARPLPRPRF